MSTKRLNKKQRNLFVKYYIASIVFHYDLSFPDGMMEDDYEEICEGLSEWSSRTLKGVHPFNTPTDIFNYIKSQSK